ncbi:hypothetical protein [Nocardia terpenica]|uniref:Uncharacterized protein n=1 Tax=Nocardia terpenica TaxID=455432 RepID=A0A6G9Z702_9NOCA|nr:hypothetical protein [Nocardia terpenica]QIS21272.1 hypothetical protein F6W96_26045 [Nocardia terpenica]
MWLNQHEAMRLTGRSLATLYAWRAKGWVKTAKTVSGRRVFDKATLLKALDMAEEAKANQRITAGAGRGNRGKWITSKSALENGALPLEPYD